MDDDFQVGDTLVFSDSPLNRGFPIGKQVVVEELGFSGRTLKTSGFRNRFLHKNRFERPPPSAMADNCLFTLEEITSYVRED
jgi:hypothetical protein